jgi:uncharacterized phiE125 gp8 family phage protein
VRYAFTLVTGPTLEPVKLAEAVEHLRLGDDASQNAKVDRSIRSARLQAEEYLRRGLVTQTWRYQQSRFSDVMSLPMAGPLAEITSIQYYDLEGDLQTLSEDIYLADTVTEPGRVVLAPDQVWPATQERDDAVQITYVVGTSAANVRADIIDAILLLVGDRYEHREQTVIGGNVATLPNGVEALLAPHRLWWAPPCRTV